MKYIFPFLFVLFWMVTSCASPKYVKNKKRFVKEAYTDESIIIEDYVFCNYMVNSWGIRLDKEFPMNEDSVFDIFKRSFSKLNSSHTYFAESMNQCDDEFRKDWRNAINTEAEVKLRGIARKEFNLQLIPVISFRSSHQSGMYFTSSGGVGGSRYLKRNDLFLTIYLLQSGTIVYRRTAVFLSDDYPAYDIMEIEHLLTQQDWDELVALVMKDYVDRLQEGTEMNKLD